MGFMDKAKKLADQAQSKLDEVQQQFNERQGGTGDQAQGAAPVEYDQHGRAVARDADEEKPQGDPLAQPVTPATPPSAPIDKSPDVRLEAADPEPPHGDPLRGAPSPPKPPSSDTGMSSGDPLAG